MSPDAKMETLQEHYFSSPASSPDPDLQTLAPERIGVPKRKGGRKPIYATSEERKQRNRQAQAAFRERRSEYIKQLETALKLNEDALRALQQSQRASADECALLQYKNSLLERMMMEKGIDVRAELQVGAIRTPHPATGHISASQPSVDREITPRHQDPQRSNSMFAKLESGQQLPFTTSDVTPACSLPLSSYTSPSPSFISHNFMPQELSAQPSFNQSYREQHKSPRRCKERSLQAPRKPHFLTQIGGPSLKTRISAKSLYNGSSIYPASCHHISQPEQQPDVSASLNDGQYPSDHFEKASPFIETFAEPVSCFAGSEQSQIPPESPWKVEYSVDGRRERGAGSSLSSLAQYGSLYQVHNPLTPMLEVDPFGRLCSSVDFHVQ